MSSGSATLTPEAAAAEAAAATAAAQSFTHEAAEGVHRLEHAASAYAPLASPYGVAPSAIPPQDPFASLPRQPFQPLYATDAAALTPHSLVSGGNNLVIMSREHGAATGMGHSSMALDSPSGGNNPNEGGLPSASAGGGEAYPGAVAYDESMEAMMSKEEEDGITRRSVFVGNVDYGSTPPELQEHFRNCGPINRITIMVDRYTGHPKGYAYIEFQDESAVPNAVQLNESMFRDRALKVIPKRKNIPGLGAYRRGRGAAAAAMAMSMAAYGAAGRGAPAYRGASAVYRGGRGRGGFVHTAASYNPRFRGGGGRDQRRTPY